MEHPKREYKGQQFLQVKLRGAAMDALLISAEKEGKTLTRYLTDLILENQQ